MTFEERYKKLNTEQKRAVDTIEGPVMVVAGPGTGKTTILTLRIANILRETDTPPSAILALTFTDSGVSAMRLKLREIIGSRADEVRIHTFHSFAGSVIAEFGEHFLHISRATQMTDVEAESIIREMLKEKKFAKLRPLGDTDYYVGKIISAISESKKEVWTPEHVRKSALDEIERIKNDPDSISSRGITKGQIKADVLKKIERCEKTVLFAEVFEQYESKKIAEKKIDFDDLLFGLVRALETDELLLRLLQEKFLYILVDEHQDTNDSQNLIVSLLANFFENPNVFVVGDEKQAIYRFQGASVENFLRFQNLWKDMQVIQLSSNYRSHQSILDASFAMIEKNYDEGEHTDLRVKLTSHADASQKPIEVVVAEDTNAEDAYVAERLADIVRTEPKSTTAIIVPNNREVERMLSLCELYGIPASAERGADIFSHPLGSVYFNLLAYFVDPTQTPYLAESLAIGLWNKNFADSVELIKKIKSGQDSAIHTEIPELATLREELVASAPVEYIILVADMSGLSKLFSKSPLSTEVFRGIVSLATELVKRGHLQSPQQLIEELLAYKLSAETKSIKINAGVLLAPVTITTAHSAKGLEYDYVFLPNATDRGWIPKSRTPAFVLPRQKTEDDETRDRRRLFYVALTRARKHAVVLTSQFDGLHKQLTPLRFIDELDSLHIEKIQVPAVKEMPKTLSHKDRETVRTREIQEYTKYVLVKKGLSVTALNHFCECPSKFYFKSILKLPESPNAISEKGTAMHKALSYVWKEKNRTVDVIDKTIREVVTDYFATSLLRTFEKDIIREELIESSPFVARELAEYFAFDGRVVTEGWFESNFNTAYDGEDVVVRLHGQLDAVLEDDESVKVFDYKTREAMSENAIRGDTEDSDGGYFRQLVFYKMLLQGDFRYTKKEILPALIFVKPDSKGRCKTVLLPIGDADIEKVKGEVETLVLSIWSGNFLTDVCDDKKCPYCAMKREVLG